MNTPPPAPGHPAVPATTHGGPPPRPRALPPATAAAAGPRRILLAAPRGFCAGVERAVATVEHALERHGPPVYVRKEIVHNRRVVEGLRERGAVFVDDTDQVPEGAVVVLSAHGVAPAVHTAAEERHLRVIDATCPLVTKVHREARRFARDGYDILLIGHAGHEEVIGTLGQAPGRTHLIDGPHDARSVRVRDETKVAWLSQTTLSVDETRATVAALQERFPALTGPPGEDICYATQNRQAAVRAIAAEADLVLVLGSANSSNSRRLAEAARDAGARAAHLVDGADEIEETWLEGATTIGLTAGASAPETLVAETLHRLRARGWHTVETVTVLRETQHFALPHTLKTSGP